MPRVPDSKMVRVLPQSFYHRPTLHVLEDLIGKVLVHDTRGCRTAGIIVEAEAYIGESDPACHAAPGPTRRNAPLYGAPGRAYVYLNYGIHYLVNVVTEAKGSPAAILIRALEPVEGIDVMRLRRARKRPRGSFYEKRKKTPEVVSGLCRGPGNLTVAMGIDLRHNTRNLTAGHLRIEDRGITADDLAWSPRIGIRVGTDEPWRCYWRQNEHVSGKSNFTKQT